MNKVIYLKSGKKHEAWFAYCFEMPETKKMLFRIGNERFIIDEEDIIKIEWADTESHRM